MPGLIVFRRRWSVGSDDLVVPGMFLFTTHLIWTIILTIVLFVVEYNKKEQCIFLLWSLVIGYLAILAVSMLLEICVCILALRGSILDTEPRRSMQYILYIRLTVMIVEAGWLSAGIAWLSNYYATCPISNAKETVLAMVVFNWCILLSVITTVWCCYDSAGRSWVKMKQYQKSMKESEQKFQYKRSGSTRNWRQRKVLRAYQDSWQNRCRFLFCCSTPTDRNRNSFADIARLLSDFFRDLDVVPSDVVVGLVLLRKFQKIERKAIVEQRKNDTYEFLSGVAVTPRTQFLSLHDNGDLELFQTVIHYCHYAVGAYGWPLYVVSNKFGVCNLCTGIQCCCCIPCRKSKQPSIEIIEDNCCQCNFSALQKVISIGDIEVIYVTYHVDVGETPFFVALDFDRKKIVISIRGTLSMKDILTDLNAESENLPLDPPREDWSGHKGMVQAAQYILDKIEQEELIERAKNWNLERGTQDFGLVMVGHSLGAGTASILGILMRQKYPTLLCYAYSPPGGLLSAPAVEYSKEFTVSVVIGKDVVPRIGLHQMETLRTDLINAIKRSVDPKWKTITCSIVCCGCSQPTSAVEMTKNETDVCEYMKTKENARCMGVHPPDSSIALTSHQPLYPPGKIIHVVRHHPTMGQQALSSKEPVYQALWVKNTDFDEVLISPCMIQDHMPDRVLDALNKVGPLDHHQLHHFHASVAKTPSVEPRPAPFDTREGRTLVSAQAVVFERTPTRRKHMTIEVVTTLGPKKPHRSSSTTDSTTGNFYTAQSNQNMFLETSFTSLQSPSSNSSVTNGFHSAKSHSSPLSLRNQPMGSIGLGLRGVRSAVFGGDNKEVPDQKNGPATLSKSLSLNLVPPSKVDLIHDDWYGLAPLASPESLSELSSIGSRISLVPTNVTVDVCQTPKFMRRTPKIIGNLSTCADDIRNIQSLASAKVFPRLFINNNNLQESSSSSNLSFESASSTANPNARCCSSSTANISRSTEFSCHKVDEIKEVFTTSDSEFQSAEDILDNVLASAGCKEFFNSESNFLESHMDLLQEGSPPPAYQSPSNTPVYPKLMSPSSPQELDPDILSNLAIDLSLDAQNRSIQFSKAPAPTPTSTATPTPTVESSVDSGSVCRTPSDSHKNVTFNPQVITVDSVPCDIRYSPPIRWRLFKGKTSKSKHNVTSKKPDSLTLTTPPIAPTTGAQPLKTILSMKSKRTSFSEDTDQQTDKLVTEECFARTEELPLLTDLSYVTTCNAGYAPNSELRNASPSYVRRKNCHTVYPSDVVMVTKNSGNGSQSSAVQYISSQLSIGEIEMDSDKKKRSYSATESAV